MRPRKRTPSKLVWQREYKVFCERMRTAREDAGLTLRAAGAALGRSFTFVARSESGERRVDIVELKQFAAPYEKPITYFVP